MSNIIYIMLAFVLAVFGLGASVERLSLVTDDAKIAQEQYNIDSATDWAMYSMLAETEDLQADYADFGSIAVDPKVAYDAFMNAYCFATYNSISLDAKARFSRDFICGLVLVHDGYYIFEPYSNSSIKIPYMLSKPGEGGKDDTRYNINISKSQLREINPITGEITTRKIEKEEVTTIISTLESEVSREINLRIQNHSGKTYQFYTPFFRNAMSGIQGINSISCVFVMDSVLHFQKEPVVAVSGSRVVLNRFVLGYTRNGTKFYTMLKNHEELENRGISIEKMFKSGKIAAELGYNFDIELEDDVNNK